MAQGGSAQVNYGSPSGSSEETDPQARARAIAAQAIASGIASGGYNPLAPTNIDPSAMGKHVDTTEFGPEVLKAMGLWEGANPAQGLAQFAGLVLPLLAGPLAPALAAAMGVSAPMAQTLIAAAGGGLGGGSQGGLEGALIGALTAGLGSSAGQGLGNLLGSAGGAAGGAAGAAGAAGSAAGSAASSVGSTLGSLLDEIVVTAPSLAGSLSGSLGGAIGSAAGTAANGGFGPSTDADWAALDKFAQNPTTMPITPGGFGGIDPADMDWERFTNPSNLTGTPIVGGPYPNGVPGGAGDATTLDEITVTGGKPNPDVPVPGPTGFGGTGGTGTTGLPPTTLDELVVEGPKPQEAVQPVLPLEVILDAILNQPPNPGDLQQPGDGPDRDKVRDLINQIMRPGTQYPTILGGSQPGTGTPQTPGGPGVVVSRPEPSTPPSGPGTGGGNPTQPSVVSNDNPSQQPGGTGSRGFSGASGMRGPGSIGRESAAGVSVASGPGPLDIKGSLAPDIYPWVQGL